MKTMRTFWMLALFGFATLLSRQAVKKSGPVHVLDFRIDNDAFVQRSSPSLKETTCY